MGERGKQTNIYFAKFMRLFVSTGGWKVFVFAAIISGMIAWVVGANMYDGIMDTQSGCFALISACIWIGIFNSIQEICKERDIIKREYRSGLFISSYILARARYELIICAVQAAIMDAICFVSMDFPKKGLLISNYTLETYIIFFVVLLSADYLGIAISCIVKTTTTAMTVMPFVLIIQLVLSGVLFVLEGAVETVADFTISKWGMRAMGCSSNMAGMTGYNTENNLYPYESSEVATSLLILVGFAILYLIIGMLFLKRVDKDKR